MDTVYYSTKHILNQYKIHCSTEYRAMQAKIPAQQPGAEVVAAVC